MYLSQLQVSNFRNYDKLSLNLKPNVNILYGNNAQGKTNILEAIYFLGSSKSHRCNNIENLIKEEKKTANVSGMLIFENSKINLFIGFQYNQKILKINNQKIKKNLDYTNVMNTVIFSPDDLEILKGLPEIRRKFLNNEISQISNSYSKILEEYNKLLKMRNDYLNNHSITFDNSYFKILTSYLIDRLISLYKYRKNYIEKINIVVSNTYLKITGISDFYIKYKPSIALDLGNPNMKDKIINEYNKILDEEKSVGKTIIGSHKDDFEFFIKDKNLKFYGSQGQQRVAIIALKLAEIEVIKDIKASTPIILLDDVFSELDRKKKNNLLEYIDNSAQVIITTTDLSNIDKRVIKNANVMKVSNGNIEKVE